MVIKVNFHDRLLQFSSCGKYTFRGEGLDELLAKISKYGIMISKVEIKGRSKSFTFTRQVYLFANIFSFILDSKVIICGRPIHGKMLFPVYPVNGVYDNKI